MEKKSGRELVFIMARGRNAKRRVEGIVGWREAGISNGARLRRGWYGDICSGSPIALHDATVRVNEMPSEP